MPFVSAADVINGRRPPRAFDYGPLTLVCEDDAAAFDPTAWNNGGALSAAESLREGEAGLALLFGLASSVAYEPHAEGNRLIVVFGGGEAR